MGKRPNAISLSIVGQNVPPAGPYVVVSSHTSHLDGPAIALALPHPVYFVIKKELAQIPLWGNAAVKIGFIAVDRSDSEQARREMVRAIDTIRAGRRVLVFPEGTRSPDGHLQAFKKGGFHLAIDAQVPILPVAVNGSYRLFPKGAPAARPGGSGENRAAGTPTTTYAPDPDAWHDWRGFLRRRILLAFARFPNRKRNFPDFATAESISSLSSLMYLSTPAFHTW